MSSFLFKTNHSKAKKLSPSRYYALAVKNSDPIQYWSGNMPPRMDRKKKNIPMWKPIMHPEPHAWDDNKLVKAAFTNYERYRLLFPKTPELVLVTLKTHHEIIEQETVSLHPIIAEHDRIFQQFGITIATAYQNIDHGDNPKFDYVVMRKGRSKKMLDTFELDGIASASVFTFARTEKEAVQLKLILGEHFDKMWCIKEQDDDSLAQ